MREAEGAFGDPTVFIEQAVVDPRHIEVQILADGAGQRDPPLRARLLGAAAPPEGRRDRARAATSTPSCATGSAPTRCASPREIGYRNAGTVEFLLDPRRQLRLHRDEPADPGRAHGHRGGHRRRPGAVAAADRVRRDARRPRAHPGRHPAPRRRAAVPDHHRGPGQRLPPRHRRDHDLPLPRRRRRPPRRRYDVHRRRGLRALRLDAGQAHLPRAAPSRTRSSKARRAVAEFRIRGVSTNIAVPPGGARRPRLPRPAGVTTSFIETHPQLLTGPRPAATAAPSCCTYLADVTVNQPHGAAPVDPRPGHQAARPSTSTCPRPTAPGSCCSSVGPEEFARRLREQNDVAVTDTTFRDAHQSLLATRVRTRDLLAVAGHVARTHARAVVARVLGRGDVRRGAALPLRGPVGAAGRAAPGGAEHLPADAAARPQHGRLHAVPDRGRPTPSSRRPPTTGIDVFRIFDALNDVEQMRPAIEAVRETGTDGRRGGALLHRRPLRPRREALHARLLPAAGRADRRRRRARAGDQGHGRAAARAGRAHAGHRAARAVRPAGAPAHPRHPGRPARHPARRDRRRGRRGRRRACASMAGTTSQPPLSALVSRDRPLRPRDRAVAGGGQRARALLGGDPPGLRAVRVRAARRRPAGSTATRSPAASSPTCASRRSRSGSARSSSRSRTCTPPPTTSSATSSR